MPLFSITLFVGGALFILLALIQNVCWRISKDRFPKWNERSIDSAGAGMLLWLFALMFLPFKTNL